MASPEQSPGSPRMWPVAAGGMLGLAELLFALLAEPALEPGDAAAGVENLLLAGVERVAIRADVGVYHAVLRRAAGAKGVPARAGHLRHHVVRVYLRLHVLSWFWRSPGRQAFRGVNRYRTNRHTSVPHR